MNKALHNRIMRRIYTAFAARIVSHSITFNVAMLSVALLVFAEAVHIERVIDAALATPLGSLPQFVLNALMRGEVVTLAAIGVMVFAALSLQWRVRSLLVPTSYNSQTV